VGMIFEMRFIIYLDFLLWGRIVKKSRKKRKIYKYNYRNILLYENIVKI